MKKFIYTLSVVTLLSGCSGLGSTAIHDPVRPESLLDLSSERVSFSLEMGNSLDELTEWVNSDQPTSAELYCTQNADTCADTENVLRQFGVPFENMAGRGAGDEVILLYDRVFTRDCAGAENMQGCSVAANTVQMVVDPRQFMDPALLDLQDAERASNVYKQYLKGGKGHKGHKKPHHW